jgi:hypothetical protein
MSLELLLADPSPCLRLMALKTLLGKGSSDTEVKELDKLKKRDPLYVELSSLQAADGSWSTLGAPFRESRIVATSLALSRLGLLGFGRSDALVKKGAAFLFSKQLRDGSWPASDEYDEEGARNFMFPLQTAFPLMGLAGTGFAENPRAEKAYGWLVSKRLPDGAWPTGMRHGVFRGVAGYRKLPHSRWGCRSNTTASVICLSLHPVRKGSEEARAGLDHLLSRETRDAAVSGFDTARLLGFEEARGALTFYAAFDPALILGLCARLGVGAKDDERVAELAKFVRGLAGPNGLWEYAANPAASRWVSFDVARSLAAVEAGGRGKRAWQSLQPRTPFAAYPKKKRRF